MFAKFRAGNYEARYRDHAGSLKSRTFTTKGEAQAWLNQVLVKLQRGDWTDPNSIKTTFKDWMEQWLKMNPNKRPTTLARDRDGLERALGSQLSEHDASRPSALRTFTLPWRR